MVGLPIALQQCFDGLVLDADVSFGLIFHTLSLYAARNSLSPAYPRCASAIGWKRRHELIFAKLSRRLVNRQGLASLQFGAKPKIGTPSIYLRSRERTGSSYSVC